MVAGTRNQRLDRAPAASTSVTGQAVALQLQQRGAAMSHFNISVCKCKYIQVWQHATLAAHAARCTQRSGGMLVAQTYIAGYLAGPAVTNMNVRPSVCLSIRLSIFLDSVSQGPKKTCFCPYKFNASPWKSLRYRIPIFDEMRVTIL